GAKGLFGGAVHVADVILRPFLFPPQRGQPGRAPADDLGRVVGCPYREVEERATFAGCHGSSAGSSHPVSSTLGITSAPYGTGWRCSVAISRSSVSSTITRSPFRMIRRIFASGRGIWRS